MINQRYRRTDGRTDDCDSKTGLCTVVHRAVKTIASASMTSLFYVTILATLCIKGITINDL